MDTEAVTERIDSIIQELTQLRSMVTEGTGVFPDWAKLKMQKRICLNCGKPISKNQRVIRGCHDSCQKQIKRSIERGELTDAQAVSRGMLAPPQSGGRKRREDTELARFIASGENKIDFAVKDRDRVLAAESKTTYKKRGKKKTTRKKG